MGVLITALLVVGLLFSAIASFGVLRLPDFYTRLHALSKAETLGVLFTLAGVAVSQGLSPTTVKVLLVALFFFLTNPIASHAIARAALRTGQRPLGETLDHR